MLIVAIVLIVLIVAIVLIVLIVAIVLIVLIVSIVSIVAHGFGQAGYPDWLQDIEYPDPDPLVLVVLVLLEHPHCPETLVVQYQVPQARDSDVGHGDPDGQVLVLV